MARKRLAQRAALVAAARAVIARDGVTATTIDAVAREIGMSKPAVHYYFPSKDALVSAVHAEVALAEIALLEAASADAATFADAADACVAAFVRRYRDDFEGFRLHYVWPHVSRPRDPVLTALPEAAGRLIHRLESLAVRDRDEGRLPATVRPRELVNVVAALFTGLVARAALFEATGGPTRVGLDAIAAEARALLALALAAEPRASARAVRGRRS